MEHGLRFIEEYPIYGKVLKKLYLSRELDEWYITSCKNDLEFIAEFKRMEKIEELTIWDKEYPSVNIFIKIKGITGDGGFTLTQELHIKVSKVIPVYAINFGYSIRHNSLLGEIGLVGAPQTLEYLEVQKMIEEIFRNNGYHELSKTYDLYDTVFEWKELKGIDLVNRRLILEDAVFVDVLELCHHDN